jgi:UDP-3-O-[3-hydroxymyristoyl] glucosamine N-acyltransferase
MKLAELSARLDCVLHGDGAIEVTGIASIERAKPGDLTFVTDPAFLARLKPGTAAAAIVAIGAPELELPTLRHRNPSVALAGAIALLRPAWRPAAGVHPTASIAPGAALGPDAYVGPFAVIGENCRVGARAVIHSHAVLYPDVVAGDDLVAHAHSVIREGTRIGNRVTLQPGVVIGSDGFGFANDGGVQVKIPQVGAVVIGDDVEIQANSCVDRATLDTTRIGSGSKLDNLVHVAHNCDVKDRVLLCAQVGLAGSTTIEDEAVLAGQAGVAGHCVVGKRAIITAQSGTHGDLAPDRVYSGSPAFEHSQWLRSSALFPRLTEIFRSVEKLKRTVERMLAEREAAHK